MAKETDSIQIAGHTVHQSVVDHVRKASQETGVRFDYLMAKAARESNFVTDSANKASSASGLYQFTRATWLEVIKKHGAEHGLGHLAAKIEKKDGEFVVTDADARTQIFDLRRDPAISSVMAGEYANDNRVRLEKALGRPVDAADLYLAHFLGPRGALKVLKARDTDPETPAAELVPSAAAANRKVFYEDGKNARSVAQVYDRIAKSIEHPMQRYASLENPANVAAMQAQQAQAQADTAGKAGRTVVADAAAVALTDLPKAVARAVSPPPAKRTLSVQMADAAASAAVARGKVPQAAASQVAALPPPPKPEPPASYDRPEWRPDEVLGESDQLAGEGRGPAGAVMEVASINMPMPPRPGAPATPGDGAAQTKGLDKLLTTVKRTLFG